jgi:four helix bundle protein
MLLLEDLDVYQISLNIGEEIWRIVAPWDSFARIAVGSQLVRSADSIAANIAEGFGRYHYKENRLFCYYARGSLLETKTWLFKAHKRALITEADFAALSAEIDGLHKKLNAYIKSIGHRNTNDK